MKSFIYVVEGYHDIDRIKSIRPNAFVVSINGSAIDRSIEILEAHKDTHHLILCMDPDHAGERIRRLLKRKFPNSLDIYIPQELAKQKQGKKIGIEHVDTIELERIFTDFETGFKENERKISDVSMLYLYQKGLIGDDSSSIRRALLCKKMGLGHANAKTLLQRILFLGITQAEIEEVLLDAST